MGVIVTMTVSIKRGLLAARGGARRPDRGGVRMPLSRRAVLRKWRLRGAEVLAVLGLVLSFTGPHAAAAVMHVTVFGLTLPENGLVLWYVQTWMDGVKEAAGLVRRGVKYLGIRSH
ncbi:hypothetical protein [Nocardia salmonicida]|uniref:hypothetical protein n=1 Tax=Nocardia salmonicida TaxID=53431 RepID=UPI0033EBEC87